MKITFLGAGYVGLTTGAAFADFGNTVWVIRRNSEKVATMRAGRAPFFEPGLDEIVGRNVKAGRLIPTTDYTEAIPNSEVIFICVDTPLGPDGAADMSQVESAVIQMAPLLQGAPIIVTKSTVPVGSAARIKDLIRAGLKPEVKFTLASSPEFLRQGNAVEDTYHPDRIVIGTDDERAREVLLKLHESFPGERIASDITSAEFIKYASNAFLAASISYANEIALLCEATGADIKTVTHAMRLDKRIGKYAFLDAGLGYGGSCFPKDVPALMAMAREHDVTVHVLPATAKVNQYARERVLGRVQEMCPDPAVSVIALWGLSFKPRTDDIRHAPSLDIIHGLLSVGYKEIRAYDPVAMPRVQSLLPEVKYCKNGFEAATGADCLIIVTEWDEFHECDFAKLKSVMRRPQIIDGRNIWNPTEMRALGFTYSSIGRP